METATLPIGSYDYDEAMIAATRADRVPRVAVYRLPEPVVVLGRGSKIEKEIFAEACIADEVPVLRRSGGGCAVVIDPGNLIVSVTLPCDGIGGNKKRFDAITAWLIAALESAGCPGVTSDGISDLVLNDKKISGSCIHQWKDLVYFSGTLLVDPDLALMETYLRHPPREPAYRRGRTHGEFCGGLAQQFPKMSAAALQAALRAALNPAELTTI